MKLISLNTWGGKVFPPLCDFISQHFQNTDIFCFQEVFSTTTDKRTYKDMRPNLLGDLKELLPDFRSVFSIKDEGLGMDEELVDFNLCYGNAIFYRSSIQVINTYDFSLLGIKRPKETVQPERPQVIRLLSIEIHRENKNFLVSTVHGITYPGSKLDTPDRITQSRKILEFLTNHPEEKILCGDFNLLPETQSIKLIEESLDNLISRFNIQDTRGSLNPFFHQPDRQRYADYTFVSQGIKVTNFEAPDARVSDHLPMILEFSL